MCGFLVVGSSELELQVFNDALNQAAYRGPDHQHVSINNGITWGFNRLSIKRCLCSGSNTTSVFFPNKLWLVINQVLR